jgi:hypothetical protein
MYAAEMAIYDMMHNTFHEEGTSVQAILRYSLSSLNGCNIGITDGKEL